LPKSPRARAQRVAHAAQDVGLRSLDVDLDRGDPRPQLRVRREPAVERHLRDLDRARERKLIAGGGASRIGRREG
jgi:hypothetical protein